MSSIASRRQLRRRFESDQTWREFFWSDGDYDMRAYEDFNRERADYLRENMRRPPGLVVAALLAFGARLGGRLMARWSL